MENTETFSTRLTAASRTKRWDVYSDIDWPDALQQGFALMSPELISIHGTEFYDELDEGQRLRLSRFEIGNFFSLVLQGERPLVQGLVHRLYLKSTAANVTDYLHHFVEEENKHMVMFGEFCKRYVGKVYPDKKMVLPRKFARHEEEVVFFSKVMVIEELGDYYNVIMAKDERVEPLVREVNRLHHFDEARHLAFGRKYLGELFDRFAGSADAETLASFRDWLVEYLRSCWSDFYNPTMYQDAGLADGYGIRQMALQHPACAANRRAASAKLVGYFLRHGMLEEEPVL